MTKTKARQRAKAKAAKKTKKPDGGDGQAAPKIRPGQFNLTETSISSPGATANRKSQGGAKRGAARSR